MFGPHPRSYTGKVNKKARGKALSIALSAHAADGTLVVADAGAFDEPKTKKAAALVAEHGLATPLVVVTAEGEDALERSFRNLHRTHVVAGRRARGRRGRLGALARRDQGRARGARGELRHERRPTRQS